MPIETPKAQMSRRQSRISFANALRTTRSTVDVSSVNEELARSFQDLAKSIFKKRVRRSEERRTAMSCRGLACRPAAHFILVRFYGVGRCVQVGRRFHSIDRGISASLLDQLWLAVDEVVHHDDVMAGIVARSRGNVAGLDPYRRNARVAKHNAEEGQVSTAR